MLLAALLALVMFGTDLVLSTDTGPTAAAAPPKLIPLPPDITLGTGGVGNSPLSPEEQVREAEVKRRDHPQGEALNHLGEDGKHLAVTDASSLRLADPSSITAIDPVTWAECESHSYDDGENTYWHKNKYNLCRLELFTITYRERNPSGIITVVGETKFVLELKGTAVNGQGVFQFDMRMRDFQHFNRTHTEWPLSIQLPCSNADPDRTSDCFESSGQSTVYRRSVREWELSAGTDFSWTKNTVTTAVPAGKYQNELRGFFEVGLYIALEAPLGPEVTASPTELLRCDSATYVNGSKCVVPRVTSVLEFSATDTTLSESSQFIRDAQTDITRTRPGIPGKKVPGVLGTGVALHRLYSAYDTNNDIKASRRKVPKTCRMYWGPKYTAGKTKQCDEYPFATTYENAARVDTRTMYDYAVRAIKKEHNEAAGRIYGVWLGADRILDGDPFYVRIVP
jgi:hypothetical protein